jgi:hypothetical protein
LGDESSEAFFQSGLCVHTTSDFVQISPIGNSAAQKEKEAKGEEYQHGPGNERKQKWREQKGANNQQGSAQREYCS